MKRHEVTDEQWEVLQPILPKRIALTGRRPSDPRLMLNGILWILRTGSPWRDLPERFVQGVPRPLTPAAEVWINPPENRPTVRTLELPRDTQFVPQLSQSH